MGFSIGKVFKPIEEEMKRYADVDSIYMPAKGYSVKSVLKNISLVRKKLKSRKYDIVHITGTEHYLIPFVRASKIVVTIHDLGSIYNSDYSWIRRWLKSMFFILPLKKARRIVFISNKSKEEALRLTKLDDCKISVIPDAVDSTYQYVEKDFEKNCPCLLHLGTKVNKNIPRTAEALKGLNCKLRIIGKLDQKQIDALTNYNINYSVAYGLTDKEIYEEYKKCDIVSFPSTYEGFGMPIIEGQSVGRVVVTSDLSPMKEVSGGGAVLVNPYSIESIRRGYEEAIVNHDKYIGIGMGNVIKYQVENIASQYYDLYVSMIEK